MKERLFSALSEGGCLILQLLIAGMIFVPLQFLGFPWWIDALIAVAIFSFRALGGLLCLVIWIWSFIIFVQQPFTGFSFIYLVFLILYVALFIAPIFLKKD